MCYPLVVEDTGEREHLCVWGGTGEFLTGEDTLVS